MKLFSLIITICNIILLEGCLSAAVVSSAAAIITKSAIDPRSLGRQIDDETLEIRVSNTINKNLNMMRNNSRIIATAYKGTVLLTGQVSNTRLAEKIKQVVTKVEGVKLVYNEIRLAIPVDIETILKDTWITAKIKSLIIINNLIKSSAVKVITESGEVFLLGILTKQEGDKIAKFASEIDGVKCVKTAFKYIN